MSNRLFDNRSNCSVIGEFVRLLPGCVVECFRALSDNDITEVLNAARELFRSLAPLQELSLTATSHLPPATREAELVAKISQLREQIVDLEVQLATARRDTETGDIIGM